ncbi:hypothetical protein JCM10908_001165 [Rhodotorula pacifica]|uniref:uncharacterized protein n=1 Tax=Rhodotorula pacifica TaxID=1495444 RepID=UPI00317E7CF9
MAAAVMRAMTFGASSSGSSSSPSSSSGPASQARGRDASLSRSRSRSTSQKARSTAGADKDRESAVYEDEGGASLSRSSSILCNYAQEGRPASILLNPLGPAVSRSPPLSPRHAPLSSTLPGQDTDNDVDFDDLQSPTPRPGYARTTSASSFGSYSAVPLSPGPGGFPTEAALLAARNASDNAPTSPNRPPNVQRASKIRFAPLPEIRPRAYSTGRNVWIVEEDDPDVVGGRRQRLVRVEGEYDDDGAEYGGDSDFAGFDDDHALGQSPGSSLSMKFGSWSEALGLSPSTSRRSTEEDGLSLSSSLSRSDDGLSTSVGSVGSGGSSKKLLKAFGLGGKSAKSKRSGGSSKDKENRDDSLSRTSSAESHVSAGRRASVADINRPSKPQGTTGIPMRKSSTWEVGDVAAPTGPQIAANAGGPVYYASPARSGRKRAQYPPVAQRRNGRGLSRQPVGVEEPAFEEWGAVGVGSNTKKRTIVGSAPSATFDDEDDGTGMAWLRKRRLQREQEQREREEREIALAKAEAEAATNQVEEPASVDDYATTAANIEENQDTLTKDPLQRGVPEEDKRMPLPFAMRNPPARSGTVDSTISTASTIRPASPGLGAKPSGLSATRPILPVETMADEPANEDDDEDDSSDDGAEARLAHGLAAPVEDETALESESGESESEAEAEEEEEEDDDDDLDEEELAREDALAEEARRMAKSMGAERYHSARHENQLKVVDA